MKLRPVTHGLSVAGLALLLVSCGDEAAPALEEGEREASSEVLEGTISDEMIPLDQVRSQAPLADPEADENGGEDGGDEGEGTE